jgi:predicted metal-binding membrane protein
MNTQNKMYEVQFEIAGNSGYVYSTVYRWTSHKKDCVDFCQPIKNMTA